MKPLHHALREARVRSGLTQTQAAELSGMPRASIGYLERTSEPVANTTLRTLRTLSGTYGCTVSELIGEEPQAERRLNVREKRVVDLVVEAMRAAA